MEEDLDLIKDDTFTWEKLILFFIVIGFICIIIWFFVFMVDIFGFQESKQGYIDFCESENASFYDNKNAGNYLCCTDERGCRVVLYQYSTGRYVYPFG